MEVWGGIIAFSVLAVSIVVIWVLIDLKRTFGEARNFLGTTGISIQASIDELKRSLEGLKVVLKDIEDIVEDISEISSSAREISENLKKISGNAADTVGRIKGFPLAASTEVSSLRAGVRTGLSFFFRNLIHGANDKIRNVHTWEKKTKEGEK